MNKNSIHRKGMAAAALVFILFIDSCSSSDQKLETAKEYPLPNEEKTIRQLSDAVKSDLAGKYAGTKVLRDAHPKHYGCAKGEFTVPELPKELQTGLFRNPGKYPVWIRYSSALTKVQPDSSKTMIGMAVKLIGVKGEKILPDRKTEKTQDFVLASGPIHPMKNADEFLQLVNRGLWYFLNPFNSHFNELKLILNGRKLHTDPMEIQYWSGTPYLFGEGKAVKYSAKPCEPPVKKLPEILTDNYLREAMKETLGRKEACFDFMIQFQKDPDTMPIEDPRSEWSEEMSPFIKTASIKIPVQSFDSERQMDFCENLSYTPWHSLPEHRPLGSINRARKDVYLDIQKFRHEKNGAVNKEPDGKEKF